MQRGGMANRHKAGLENWSGLFLLWSRVDFFHAAHSATWLSAHRTYVASIEASYMVHGLTSDAKWHGWSDTEWSDAESQNGMDGRRYGIRWAGLHRCTLHRLAFHWRTGVDSFYSGVAWIFSTQRTGPRRCLAFCTYVASIEEIKGCVPPRCITRRLETTLGLVQVAAHGKTR